MRETHGTDVTRGASGASGASGDILSHVIHVPKEKVPGVKGPGSVWLREHPPPPRQEEPRDHRGEGNTPPSEVRAPQSTHTRQHPHPPKGNHDPQ